MTPEGKVKARVKRVLEKYDLVYRFMPVQSGYGAKTLDFLVCVNGKFLAIETKAPGKQLTELQRQTARDIVAARGKVLVVDGDTTQLELYLKRTTHVRTRKPKT